MTYAVFRSPSPGEAPTLLAATDLEAMSATLSGLIPGEYEWRVVAMDDHHPTPDRGTSSATGTFRICPPGPPADLAASPGSPAVPRICLSWSAAAGAKSYAVFRSRESGGPPVLQVASGIKATTCTIDEALTPGEYRWRVVALNDLHPTAERGTPSKIARLRVVQGPLFRRGDSDGSGSIEVTDAIFMLYFLFLGGGKPPCLEAADADDSGAIDLTDAIFTLYFLFLGGDEPPAPGPRDCGEDPRPAEGLGCESYGPCC